MSGSVLNETKKLLGLPTTTDDFNQDIIVGINATLVSLKQLGVIEADFSIVEDDETSWTDIFTDRDDLTLIKSYIYQKVRLFFDPPTNSFLVDAITRQIDELEWRLREENEDYDVEEVV